MPRPGLALEEALSPVLRGCSTSGCHRGLLAGVPAASEAAEGGGIEEEMQVSVEEERVG